MTEPHDVSDADDELARRAAARLPQGNVPPRAVFLAIAAVFSLGVLLGYVLGRTA
jgi:hypothetical protein